MIKSAVIFTISTDRRYRDRVRPDARSRLALAGALWLLALVIFA